MFTRNMKNYIGFLNVHDGHNYNIKEKICAVVGINTPLFPFVSMLIKMNSINMKRKDNNDEFNTK